MCLLCHRAYIYSAHLCLIHDTCAIRARIALAYPRISRFNSPYFTGRRAQHYLQSLVTSTRDSSRTLSEYFVRPTHLQRDEIPSSCHHRELRSSNCRSLTVAFEGISRARFIARFPPSSLSNKSRTYPEVPLRSTIRARKEEGQGRTSAI